MSTSFAGKKVAVWGAARSGIAVANLLVAHGAQVVLSDQRNAAELNDEKLDKRVELIGGQNEIGDAEILVPSPGIFPSNPILQAARRTGIQLMSEIEVAALFARAPILAITGTDGKTTTTEMSAAAIRATGKKAIVAGNIGDPFSARVLDAEPSDVLVIEVSAFQLWSAGHFSPAVAIITNVAGDHADYFENDVEVYAQAKARLLKDMVAGTTAILRSDDPVVSQFETPFGVNRVLFQPSAIRKGWGVSNGWIQDDGRPVMAIDTLNVSGLHNVCNAQAALAAVAALGLSQDDAIQGLQAFIGLPHRTESVREINGVQWVNDSKATNPHAAAAGLNAYDAPKVVITGGYDKGLDLKPFIDALGDTRHVIVTGTTAARTEAAMNGRWPVSHAKNMTEAVLLASKLAQPGDIVILSPAASSFDAYQSYAHRGEVFKDAVKRLP